MNIETKTKRKFVWIVGLACLFGVLVATSAQAQVKVGDNPTTIDARSVLELESTTQALYLPRLSTADLAGVSGWKEGMVVYNTTDDCIQIFSGTTWNCVDTDNDGIYDGSGDLTSTVDVRQANFDMTFTNTGGDFKVDTTTLVVDASENRVGIGVTAPKGGLEIREDGTDLTSGTVDRNDGLGGLYLSESSSSANFGSGIWFDHGTLLAGIASARENTSNWGTDLRFYTHGTALSGVSESYERMRIDPAGRVGIGTTTPNATLDVNGSVAHNITTSATIGDDAHFVIIAGGAVTLPTPSSNTGRVLHFINTHATNAITFTTAPTGSITQVNAGMSASAICDGTTWYWYSIN